MAAGTAFAIAYEVCSPFLMPLFVDDGYACFTVRYQPGDT